MKVESAPREVEGLARARSEARRARDWARADELRAQIEAAGWRVRDSGTRHRLEPLRPPDLLVGGRVVHGSTAWVPSRLEEPPTETATLVVLAGPADTVEAVRETLRSAAGNGRAGSQVVVAADAVRPEVEALLLAEEGAASLEVVWLAGPLGPAAAANAGLRTARGRVVILLAAGAELPPGRAARLVDVLADPSVAVAGTRGLGSTDLRRFTPAAAGEVAALALDCLALRRDEYKERGPLDEKILSARYLGPWISLLLRDEGPERAPRRALAIATSPADGDACPDEGLRDRTDRRSFYRLLDRFGGRPDLLGLRVSESDALASPA